LDDDLSDTALTYQKEKEQRGKNKLLSVDENSGLVKSMAYDDTGNPSRNGAVKRVFVSDSDFVVNSDAATEFVANSEAL
jgi:hypothetical protein